MCNEQTIQQTDFANQLITKQAAIDAIEITPFDDYGDYMRARELIEQLPSAQPRHYHEENLLTYAHDMGVTLEQAKKELTRVSQIAPQRIKGKWVRKESDLSWWYECSECGESPLFDPYENEVRTPFCPWCGADMRGEEDG